MAGLALLAAHYLLGFGRENGLLENWVYDGLMLGSAGLCLSRVRVRDGERLAWTLIGGALLTWALADIYWTSAVSGPGPDPFPSLADVGYLAYYPLILTGMVLLVRTRLVRVPLTTWLDGAIAALAISMVGVGVLLRVVVDSSGGGLGAAASIAYPLGDILTVAFAVAVLVLIRGVPDRAWELIIGGLTVTALADAIYAYQAAVGSYAAGGWVDLLWPLGAVTLALAAWRPAKRRTAAPARDWRAVIVPCSFALVIAVRLAISPLDVMYPLAAALFGATLTAIIARLVVTIIENQRLVQRIETDPLTGLANRGKLIEDLRSALHAGVPQMLTVFDLDGFKPYNDTFGHPAGDVLLGRLGRQLQSSVPGGRAYRIGGDEFCVLTPAQAWHGAGEAAAALTISGDGFRIDSSHGSVTLPEEAATPSEALQIADKRMYAHKDSRRLSAAGQAKAVLQGAMEVRTPELGRHAGSVSDLAIRVGARLGMERGELLVLDRAAVLHDVGKLAVPDAILGKPGPLDKDEWTLMRTHTLLGERIAASAPALGSVAEVIRSSHEHFDGSGYPDGLAGEQIPLASRVILACDAFEAMVSERPYAPALSVSAARTELRRCSGTQFDPIVVDALLEELASTPGQRSQSGLRSPDTGDRRRLPAR